MVPCVVIINEDNVVDEIKVCSDGEHAERVFLDVCSTRLSNWDEYDAEDIEAILEQGYEEFGKGSICLSWAEEELTVNDDLLKACVMVKEFLEKHMPTFKNAETDVSEETDLDILGTESDAMIAGLNMAINKAKTISLT